VLVAAYRELGMDDLATDSQRVLAETYENGVPTQASADELRPAPEPPDFRPPSDSPT
jgi:outer membrane protein assembly factor BamD (BamD/ComL family)